MTVEQHRGPFAETVRRSDITLGISVMFDQCPGNAIQRSVELLAARPKELGIAYPANACWRFRALGKGRYRLLANQTVTLSLKHS